VEEAPEDDERKHDASRRLMIGLVGYPNVGKSSTINAIFGAKKTAVAPTPGKTKHFQTLNVSATVGLWLLGAVVCCCAALVVLSTAALVVGRDASSRMHRWLVAGSSSGCTAGCTRHGEAGACGASAACCDTHCSGALDAAPFASMGSGSEVTVQGQFWSHGSSLCHQVLHVLCHDRLQPSASRVTCPSLRVTCPSLRVTCPSLRVTCPSLRVTCPSYTTASVHAGVPVRLPWPGAA
jgi:hypothetical protein